ncbi:3'-5' exonuclease [Leptothoe sp. ISB3NOV94-8A]
MTPIAARNNAIQTAQAILANPDRYVILDTETSGLGKTAEILEIAIIDPVGATLCNYFLDPVHAIAPAAAAIHGLTKDVLKAKGAIAWPEIHDEVVEHLDGKTLVAYNAVFDMAMLDATAILHGRDTPHTGDILCAMRLWQRFRGATKVEALEGDHSALGDCLATLERIKEIANSSLEDDPDLVDIQDVEDLVQWQARIEELTAQRNALDATVKSLKAQVTQYLIDNGAEAIPLSNGKQVKLYRTPTKIKPLVPLEELPERYLKQAVDQQLVKAEIKSRHLEDGLFSYETSNTIRFVKL